ncbi:Rossmann-fold NAD(P)-binding domain-containing protein [Nocardiopsis baichengensis]|uniref:hypothetical protein n=1 Tax=Nocardiopsis baichengensis TaxID=280240 RepID=UPI001EF9EC6B|nr:hypothetical protein [Nocardiopsis baichengensis]
MDGRDSVRRGMAEAVAAAPELVPVDAAAEADLIVRDVCGSGPSAPGPGRPDVPLVVLSVAAADRAPAGSFAAEAAAREAAAVAGADRWCVLRCAAFGEELAWNTRYTAEGGLMTAWRPGGAPWVAAADVVALVARLASAPERWNAAYDVTGPERVPMDRVCNLLHDLHGRPLHYVHLEPEALASGMEQAGFDPAFAARRADYMSWTTSGPCREVSPVLADALGRPATPLSDYLVRSARSGLTAAR